MKEFLKNHRNAAVIAAAVIILAVIVGAVALSSGKKNGSTLAETAVVTETAAAAETPAETEAPVTVAPAETAPAVTEAPAETTASAETTPAETTAAETAAAETSAPAETQAPAETSGQTSADPAAVASAEPTPAATEQPVQEPEKKADTCTISISCWTILNNMDLLAAEKQSLVPANGTILRTTTVEIQSGDTVFDVLQRVTRANGILMEYTSAGSDSTAYIEGIGGLYEFDCGELSGWMYRVNGVFPNVGCDQVPVSNGDTIEWLYTCDLGDDVR